MRLAQPFPRGNKSFFGRSLAETLHGGRVGAPRSLSKNLGRSSSSGLVAIGLGLRSIVLVDTST